MKSILPTVTILQCGHSIHDSNTGETWKRALAILRHSRIHFGYIGVIGIDQPGQVQRLPVSSYQSTSPVSLPSNERR